MTRMRRGLRQSSSASINRAAVAACESMGFALGGEVAVERAARTSEASDSVRNGPQILVLGERAWVRLVRPEDSFTRGFGPLLCRASGLDATVARHQSPQGLAGAVNARSGAG